MISLKEISGYFYLFVLRKLPDFTENLASDLIGRLKSFERMRG